VRYEGVIPKISGIKYAPHNLIDIDYSGQLSIFSADPMHDVADAP
jgi:hypothetical protein